MDILGPSPKEGESRDSYFARVDEWGRRMERRLWIALIASIFVIIATHFYK